METNAFVRRRAQSNTCSGKQMLHVSTIERVIVLLQQSNQWPTTCLTQNQVTVSYNG